MVRTLIVASLAGLGIAAVSAPASALTMKECSTKFKAAKQDGTLGGQSWKEFRAAQCTSATSAKSSSSAPTTTTTATAPAVKPGAPVTGPDWLVGQTPVRW